MSAPYTGAPHTSVRRLRPRIDVAALPDTAFGVRDIMWWGTLGFIVIEGFTLALCAVAWLYLRNRTGNWPPPGTPLPSLALPSGTMVAMILSLPLATWTSRAAKKYDINRTRIGLAVLSVFAAIFVGLRILTLLYAVNVKWDTNAYGSSQWLVLGVHGTLLLVELVEVAGMGLIFWIGTIEEKHFSDAADLTFYWYFMVLIWVPLYFMCFLVPRWGA
jgi:cytochrome c oxidase subunit III